MTSLTPIPGQIKLPGSPNGGLFSVPTIASRGLPLPNNGLAGMIIPSGPILPTASVQNGMLFFLKFVDEEENLYIRINNAWRRAVTG